MNVRRTLENRLGGHDLVLCHMLKFEMDAKQ